jgi:hypothetical protein
VLLFADLQVDAAVASVTAHAEIAAKYGKPLITYEAGSSIDGNTDFAAQVWLELGFRCCLSPRFSTINPEP